MVQESDRRSVGRTKVLKGALLFDPGSASMIEIVTALLAFLSIDVFLAHAFDTYRTG
jgi:hypothetical protein